jgi:hypothetical protein
MTSKVYAVAKVVMTKPTPNFSSDKSRRCVQLFNPVIHHETIWVEGENGHMVFTVFKDYNPLPPIIDTVPEMILNQWEKRKRITTETVQQIREIKDGLDRSRSTYFGYIHQSSKDESRLDTRSVEQPFSGARLYDGSKVPLYNGYPLRGVSEKTAKLTFEDDLAEQGYRFPERILEEETGRPAYILEFGLLNIQREYVDGLQTLFGILARDILDPNYNNNHYNIKSNLDVLKRHNVVIYAYSRETHLGIYKKVGFQQVMHPETGVPLKTSEGLIILKMSTEYLMVTYSDIPVKPLRRNEEKTLDQIQGAEKKQRVLSTEYFESLQERAPEIKTQLDFAIATYRLSVLHHKLFNAPLSELVNHPDLQYLKDQYGSMENAINTNKYTLFFEASYMLAYARIRLTPAEDVHLVDKMMYPYELMVHNFNNHEQFYKDFLTDQALLTITPIWNRQEIMEFLREYGSLIRTNDLKSNYLKNWL